MTRQTYPPRSRRDPRHRASTTGIILMATGFACASGCLLALMNGENGLAVFTALFGLICAHGTITMYRIAALPGFQDPHDPDTRAHG